MNIEAMLRAAPSGPPPDRRRRDDQLLGQLVPYGLYYGTVVPQLTTQLGLCHGCLPFPGPQSEAVSNITDFDWRYAPLTVQVKYLLQGITAPPWAEIAVAMPLLLGLVGYGLFRVQRLAVGLDVAAKEKGRPAGRPLRRSSSG